MTIRYERRGLRTATAETRRTACRLTRRGMRRCTVGEWRQAHQVRDNAARLELAQADLRALQRMSYAERVKRGV